MERVKVHLSTGSIVRAVLVLLGFFLVYLLSSILVMCFVVLILVAALRPAVRTLMRFNLSRIAASSLLLITLAGAGAALVIVAGRPLVAQAQQFATQQLPEITDDLNHWYQQVPGGKGQVLNARSILDGLLSRMRQVGQHVLDWAVGAFTGLFTVLTVLILTFYLLSGGKELYRDALRLVPRERRAAVATSVERSADRLGYWLRGQFLVCLIVGSANALGYWLVGVPAPLAMGLIAAVLELIPYVGPIATAALGMLVAAATTDDPYVKVAMVAVFSTLIQQLENNVLLPRVMERAVGLNPALVIVSVLIGWQLAGVAGAVLALPLVAVLQAVLESWDDLQEESPAPSVSTG